jgi:TetR/AcrR family transcriptional regulator
MALRAPCGAFPCCLILLFGFSCVLKLTNSLINMRGMPAKRSTQARTLGRPIAADGAVARERLLDAALALISERGVAATSIAQIAERAGVTPAMVHYYFKNRELLLDALVAERLMRVILSVWGPIDAVDDPFDAVEGLVRRVAVVAREWPHIPALWLREIISDGGQLRERVLPYLPTDKLMRLNTLIARGQQEGRVNPALDVRYMFMSVIGLIMMPLAVSAVFGRVTGQQVDVDTLVEHAVTLLRGGMQVSKPQQRS